MGQKTLYFLWGGLFVLCAGLGFLPEPEGAVSTVLTLLSLFFFLPPALLLYRAKQIHDRGCILLIRNLSGLSLVLTLLLLIVNFLSVMGGEFVGKVLYYLLVIVSSPMICSGYWAMSLFGWACLLTAGQKLLKTR